MIDSVIVTTSDGKNITLESREDLEDADTQRKICLVFNNLDCYHGYFKFIDEEGDICIGRTADDKGGLGLPMARIVGWFYE